MDTSRRTTKVFGLLHFDYNAQRHKLRRSCSQEELEDYYEKDASVRYARNKSTVLPKHRVWSLLRGMGESIRVSEDRVQRFVHILNQYRNDYRCSVSFKINP